MRDKQHNKLNYLSFLFVWIWIFPVLPTTAYAAGENGNGGDSKPSEYQSAWFTGKEKEITVCYEISELFDVDPSTVEQNIYTAFQEWKGYFTVKVAKSPYSFNYIHYDLFPTFNIKILSQCSGDQDLAFYLGVNNAQVEAAKKEYFNPIAMAVRTEYNLDKGWGKGFIWLAEKYHPINYNFSWSMPYFLKGVMMHELGHVFGCEHLNGTIMTENIIGLLKRVLSKPDLGEDLLNHIDRRKELVFNSWYGVEVRGSTSFTHSEDDAEIKDPFRLFVGREPVGEITASMKMNGPNYMDLVLTDSQGSKVFKINFVPLVHGDRIESQTKAFKAVKNVIQNNGIKMKVTASVRSGEGSLGMGRIKDARGIEHVCFFRQNLGDWNGSLSAQYFKNPSDHHVFDLFVPSNKTDFEI